MEIIKKPWGHERIFIKTDKYAGKILFIKEGEILSLQHHNIKEETMLIKSGFVSIQYGWTIDTLKEILLKEHDVFHIPPKTIHRVKAIVDSEIFEISTPELDDIVRHEDRYGRV
jgi:mannose-6-phosphate isomerase-like protein (cupin superfamily)